MKKIIAIILTLMLFTACTVETVEEEAKITQIITEETETYIVEVEYPAFEGMDNINQLIKAQIMSEIDTFKKSVAEFDEERDPEFDEALGDMTSGFYTNYTIYGNTDGFISIGFENSIYYEGAAHGMTYTTVFNYDLIEDREILLGHMFIGDNDYISAVSYTVIPELNSKLNEDEFAEDEWIAEGAGSELENFEAFTLTETSFIFHFDPYQVAAYAAGPQQVEVPFRSFWAILDPKWRPAENGDLVE